MGFLTIFDLTLHQNDREFKLGMHCKKFDSCCIAISAELSLYVFLILNLRKINEDGKDPTHTWTNVDSKYHIMFIVQQNS